ncbi:MAG: hypothetical protein AB1540_16830, partial [Bdellovibrionota bacterium]
MSKTTLHTFTRAHFTIALFAVLFHLFCFCCASAHENAPALAPPTRNKPALCPTKVASALLRNVEKRPFPRDPLNPSGMGYQLVLHKLFTKHPELKKKPFYKMIQWLSTRGEDGRTRLASPTWQFFLDRWLVSGHGYTNLKDLAYFLNSHWESLSPQQKIEALKPLEEAINKSPVLRARCKIDWFFDFAGQRVTAFLPIFHVIARPWQSLLCLTNYGI